MVHHEYMMFEEDRTRLDRAYVAAPASMEDGVKLALKWCLEKVNGDYRKVGLRIPNRRLMTSSSNLQQLEARGVAVSGESRRGVHNTVEGPLIVLSPTLESLCEAEDMGNSTAIVVVGAQGAARPGDRLHNATPHAVGILPWVSAFDPEYLGGTRIDPVHPILTDPVLQKAMETFTNSINSSTGLSDSRDRSRVTDGLTKLHKSGHPFDPNNLLSAALALNWRGSAAWDLKELAKEINGGARKRIRESYREDIVRVWELDASNARK